MFFLFVCVVSVAVVVYVLEPVFDGSFSATNVVARSGEAEDAKDQLYQAILELDFDYRAGLVEDDDYRTLREHYLHQVAHPEYVSEPSHSAHS